jgi:hypothetical protein
MYQAHIRAPARAHTADGDLILFVETRRQGKVSEIPKASALGSGDRLVGMLATAVDIW